jgi:hypothetical protein
MTAGSHVIEFNSIDLAAGVYFFKIKAGSSTESKKMVLIK